MTRSTREADVIEGFIEVKSFDFGEALTRAFLSRSFLYEIYFGMWDCHSIDRKALGFFKLYSHGGSTSQNNSRRFLRLDIRFQYGWSRSQ